MLEFPLLYFKGMRLMMFQLSGFYCTATLKGTFTGALKESLKGSLEGNLQKATLKGTLRDLLEALRFI